VDDSAWDFLGDDFTALDFVDLAMMNKIYVRNEERDDNEGRGKERQEGTTMKKRLTNT
jgi:hypothetical protein